MLLKRKKERLAIVGDQCYINNESSDINRDLFPSYYKSYPKLKYFSLANCTCYIMVSDKFLGSKNYVQLIPVLGGNYSSSEFIEYFLDKNKRIIVHKSMIKISVENLEESYKTMYGDYKSRYLLEKINFELKTLNKNAN